MLICMDAHISEPSDGEVSWAVDTLKMLADPTRLRIVWALLHGEHSVGRLAEHVDAQPAAVSQHLAKLRLARLVRTRRAGTHVYYQIENDHIRRLVTEALFNADHAVGDGAPAHHELRPGGLGDGGEAGFLVAPRRGSSVT
jgi:DNA-binding transcriptional ArsR family regulator